MPDATLTYPCRRTPSADGDWRQQLRTAIQDPLELLRMLGIHDDGLAAAIDRCSGFRMRVPLTYVRKMQYADPHDPLLRQVLPMKQENADDGVLDPVADLDAMLAPGLLQKYHGRALLITTGACAVNCRYCFRRHYPYSDAGCSTSGISACIEALAAEPEIDEIILSGGDPLVLDDDRLDELLSRLAGLPQLRYLRLHTRLPVVLPDRITARLARMLGNSRLRTTVVIHANHANEIGEREQQVLADLAAAGVTLMNQSVLLRGINDDSDKLAALSKRLYDCHVIPYYLHLLDPVRGAMHFEVAEDEARRIVHRLRATLPGYMVPTLVRELPESPAKTAIPLF